MDILASEPFSGLAATSINKIEWGLQVRVTSQKNYYVLSGAVRNLGMLGPRPSELE